jgi:hypothetical protein
MKKLIYISLFFSILAYSCTEVINLDLKNGENNRLVVEGSITNEYKIHEIKLSRSADYYFNQPALPELGASVSINDGDTIMSMVDTENKGIYKTEKSCAGKIDHAYTLNIITENGEQYSATDTIRPVSQMDSIKYEYGKSENPFDKKYYYNINIFAQENPEPGNYYQWELFIDDQNATDTVSLKVFVSDDLVNGAYISNWTVYSFPDYKIKNDTSDIRLQMLSISKEKYYFYTAILLETSYSGGPFSGPAANIPTNISNGALGFFSASAVTEKKIKLIKHVP